MIGEHLDDFGGLPVHDFPVPWQDEICAAVASAPVVARPRDVLAVAGVRLDLDPGDAREHAHGDEVWRYVSVSE